MKELAAGNQEPDRGRGFRKLVAWEKADQLASAVFQLTHQLPRDDRWLGVQMLRAAVSVPANIAEGYGRGTLRDYLRFLEIAGGSLNEVEYYLHFLSTNGILKTSEVKEVQALQHEAGAVLSGLERSLRGKLKNAAETWQRGLIKEEREEYLPLGDE